MLHDTRRTSAVVLLALLAACGSSEPSAPRQWRFSCGDPVCSGARPHPGVAACTTERPETGCAAEGASCDLQDPCNRLLVCSSVDPRTQPGGCPISRVALKQDVAYLDAAARQRFHDELVRTRLATWRYREGDPRPRLGFLIDDQPLGTAVDPERDLVDLYGYTSLTVAALQVQAAEIAALREQVTRLEREIRKR